MINYFQPPAFKTLTHACLSYHHPGYKSVSLGSFIHIRLWCSYQVVSKKRIRHSLKYKSFTNHINKLPFFAIWYKQLCKFAFFFYSKSVAAERSFKNNHVSPTEQNTVTIKSLNLKKSHSYGSKAVFVWQISQSQGSKL